MDAGTNANNGQNSNQPANFDPNQDVDLSNIQIIDTSKGDQINIASTTDVYSYKCSNCNFKYEGYSKITACPKCGSTKIVDL